MGTQTFFCPHTHPPNPSPPPPSRWPKSIIPAHIPPVVRGHQRCPASLRLPGQHPHCLAPGADNRWEEGGGGQTNLAPPIPRLHRGGPDSAATLGAGAGGGHFTRQLHPSMARAAAAPPRGLTDPKTGSRERRCPAAYQPWLGTTAQTPPPPTEPQGKRRGSSGEDVPLTDGHQPFQCPPERPTEPRPVSWYPPNAPTSTWCTPPRPRAGRAYSTRGIPVRRAERDAGVRHPDQRVIKKRGTWRQDGTGFQLRGRGGCRYSPMKMGFLESARRGGSEKSSFAMDLVE